VDIPISFSSEFCKIWKKFTMEMAIGQFVRINSFELNCDLSAHSSFVRLHEGLNGLRGIESLLFNFD
jgi:hypothetical protein